jgi:hypothetical protein
MKEGRAPALAARILRTLGAKRRISSMKSERCRGSIALHREE